MKKIIIIGTLLTFVINLIWENIQAPLYVGYTGFWQHFVECLPAVLGDIMITVLLYIFIAWIYGNKYWIRRPRLKHYASSIFFGAILAISIERFALVSNWWQYAGMPIIPLINVGITPVLQMMIIPVIVFFIINKVYNEKG